MEPQLEGGIEEVVVREAVEGLNNFPKCNKVLNVKTFGPICNKVLNVISLQCNRLTPSVHCFYGGHSH